MKYSEIQEYAKKININEIKQLGYKPSSDIKHSIEIFNSAINNIKVKNTDIAIIKLKKAVSISPEFRQARKLLTMLLEFEKSKVNNIDTETKKKELTFSQHKKRPLPERLNINPRTLMKIIVGGIAILIVVTVILIVVNLLGKKIEKNDNQQVLETNSQLQATILELNRKIDKLNSDIDIKNKSINENTTKTVVLEQSIEDYENLNNILKQQNYYYHLQKWHLKKKIWMYIIKYISAQ